MMAQTDADLDAEKGEKQTDLRDKIRLLNAALGSRDEKKAIEQFKALEDRLRKMNENDGKFLGILGLWGRKDVKYEIKAVEPPKELLRDF